VGSSLLFNECKNTEGITTNNEGLWKLLVNIGGRKQGSCVVARTLPAESQSRYYFGNKFGKQLHF